MMRKSGKLRSLIRDIKRDYDDATATAFLCPRHLSTVVFRWTQHKFSKVAHLMNKTNHCFRHWWPSLALTPRLPIDARYITGLETEIKKIDSKFFDCQEAWAVGESDNWRTDRFLFLYKYMWLISKSHDAKLSTWQVIINYTSRKNMHSYFLNSAICPLISFRELESIWNQPRFYQDAEAAMKAATFVW